MVDFEVVTIEPKQTAAVRASCRSISCPRCSTGHSTW